jgi:hypothetical protein
MPGALYKGQGTGIFLGGDLYKRWRHSLLSRRMRCNSQVDERNYFSSPHRSTYKAREFPKSCCPMTSRLDTLVMRLLFSLQARSTGHPSFLLGGKTGADS